MGRGFGASRRRVRLGARPRRGHPGAAMRLVLLILAAALAAPAAAQSELEAIVVTGTRISTDDYSGTPAVTVQRRADFLVLPVTLLNDTRDADARRRELH